MLDKTFEFKRPFLRDADNREFPIIEVRFLTAFGQWLRFPMLFDTGATDVVLRPRYARLFPVARRWESVSTAGQSDSHKDVPIVDSQITLFGHVEGCEILLMDIPPHPLYAGLLGRSVFKVFGFGFWERAGELYVTSQP